MNLPINRYRDCALRAAAGLGLAALTLNGCATPTYPTDVHAGGAAATSSTSSAAAAPTPAAGEAASTPPPAADTAAPTAAPPTTAVETAPLPPAIGARSSASPASGSSGPPPSTAVVGPAQTIVPPTYTPPPASAAIEPTPPAASPQPAVSSSGAPTIAPSPAARPNPPASIRSSAPPPPRPIVRAAPPQRGAIYTPTAETRVRYRQVPGRVIAGGKVVAATGMYRDYEVQAHDHLDAIARDLATTRKVLVDANHLKAPYGLQPGQHLKVPVAKAYQAEAADTLADVAKRFSQSPASLAELNDLPEKAKLRPGERIALPDRFEDRGPTRLAATTIAERVSVPSRRPSSVAPLPTAVAASSPSQPRAEGGPYVPSPAALAAAQRLAMTRSYGPPSYAPGRPGPNTAIAPQTYRPSSYAPPSYQPPAYQGAAYGGRSPAALAALARGRFIWPVRGAIISGFGVQGVGRRNDGIDIRSPAGSPVRVAATGEVVYAGNEVPGFGNLVLVKHPDGWVTAYAHLASIGVQMRQSVVQGQTLGDVGATGSVPEAQLHFEVRYAAAPTDKPRPVDPLLVLPR